MPPKKSGDGLSDTDRHELEEILGDRKFYARLRGMLKRIALAGIGFVALLKTFWSDLAWMHDKLMQWWK